MGALRSGIHEILLPEGNVSDLEEVDENVRNAVTYRAVSHMDQVLEIALCPLPENAEYSGEEISMVMPEQRGREGTRVGV